MTAFHVLQTAVAIVAAVLVYSRMRALMWQAPLDVVALERVTVPLLRDRTCGERLSRLLRSLEPAWVATLLAAALAEPAGPRRDAAVLEQRAEIARGGAPKVYPIVALARIAVPLSLVNVILEISWALSGGSGLIALQRGLAARIALERALLAVAIGLATTAVCLSAARVLRRQIGRLERDMARAEGWLDLAVGDDLDARSRRSARELEGAER